jgi:hypothetical protein
MTFHLKSYEVVFLTRGELHIHSKDSLSIHLKPNDKRLKTIYRLMDENKLQIVTISPQKPGHFIGFYPGSWYLIPKLKYTGRTTHSGYEHISFTYKNNTGYNWGSDVVKILPSYDLKTVRTELIYKG